MNSAVFSPGPVFSTTESLQVHLSLTGKLEFIFLIWQMFISQVFVSTSPSWSQKYVLF